MQKIFVNGKPTATENFISLMTADGEVDFDALGAELDSDTLDKAIDSFDKSYDLYELIERYLQLADKPIICEVAECQN
jgi:hypothetical protein